MKDFDFKIFFELHEKHLRYAIAQNPDFNVLHLGKNDDGLDNFKILKNSLEHLDIYTRPRNMEEVYHALDIRQGHFSNYLKIDEWMNRVNEYDLVFNVEDSGKLLDQIKYFEALDRIVKPGGFIVHVVPYNSIFEKTYFSYNPVFFGAIAEHFDYEVPLAYIGNLDGNKFLSTDIKHKFNEDKYLKQYAINSFWLPRDGMRSPLFLGIVFKKKSKRNDTDFNSTDEVEIQS